ncbi:MAG TPA: transketolase C-terminal domain-containing protein [Steroidobacteraceae bacterium]
MRARSGVLQPITRQTDDQPTRIDWSRVAYRVLLSRALDDLEQKQLLPQRHVLYQFCARGHELAQSLLGEHLNGAHDGVGAYYRGRPLLFSLGLTPQEALASTMMRAGSISGGRDVGVVYNMPRGRGATVLPGCGGVGTQYTPTVGWGQALVYRARTLRETGVQGSIAVATGGEGSVATNGFWAALTIATTEQLPVLFFIEDNGYAISVPGIKQTPGGNIAANLAAFKNLQVFDGDGTDPQGAATLIAQAVTQTRSWQGPVLIRLLMPRLSGHSGQDTQAYKSAETLAAEKARDPLDRLKQFLVPGQLASDAWAALEKQARQDVAFALMDVQKQPSPDPTQAARHVFSEIDADGKPIMQRQGGVVLAGHLHPVGSIEPSPEPTRINMLTAIRRTLDVELTVNPRMLIFGEDVGPKGGVHAATLGLQEKYGAARVFDTSLSEEGIIGRAVGMAVAGLMPVPEIQFRKYADSAAEQLNDCGTIRWRTANRFAAPMVVRIPGGFFKCGDPWHSQTSEVQWVHGVGWRVAVPSNAEDAVGLLRAALRGNDPTIFFEHRAMLDGAWARRPYPGDSFIVPFGQAKTIRAGSQLTVVTWGAMVERCEAAAAQARVDAEILDLRTLMPWDRGAVLASVQKTRRCLIVHEDIGTAGFGAEIAAVVAKEAFFSLDAPIERLTMPDMPSPHSLSLFEAVVPSIDRIAQRMRELAEL